MSQNPAITSLASVNGPSVTIFFPPVTRIRNPLDVAWSPSAERSTPAFFISSLYSLIAVTISLLGAAANFSNGSGGAGSSIMNRTIVSPLESDLGAGSEISVQPSIITTNCDLRNRHRFLFFLGKLFPQFAGAVDRLAGAEILQFEKLADLNLAVLLMGIRRALGPFNCFFPGFHLNNPIASDQFFAFREWPIYHCLLAPRELDAGAF